MICLDDLGAAWVTRFGGRGGSCRSCRGSALRPEGTRAARARVQPRAGRPRLAPDCIVDMLAAAGR